MHRNKFNSNLSPVGVFLDKLLGARADPPGAGRGKAEPAAAVPAAWSPRSPAAPGKSPRSPAQQRAQGARAQPEEPRGSASPEQPAGLERSARRRKAARDYGTSHVHGRGTHMCPHPFPRRSPVIVVPETAKYLACQASHRDPPKHPPTAARFLTI